MKITDANERANKGYDDKKEFTCVCCGKTVLLTKFASAKTAKCPECKSAGKQVNPDLVPTSTSKAVKSAISGNTKTLPCVKCGTMVEVSKFMSAAKVLCNDCKGDNTTPTQLKIDVSKINKDTMPAIEDYNILPSNIANKKLRSVTCPACGEPHMRILNILDYSSFGLVIHYQCNNCKLLLSVSEQCYFKCPTHKMGVTYDYSGHAIEDLMDGIESTRIHGTIVRLYGLLKEHNISVEGIELPPYRYEEDKPVPVGFSIPPADMWVKTVDDSIQIMEDLLAEMEPGHMHRDDLIQRINALKGLFKENNDGRQD